MLQCNLSTFEEKKKNYPKVSLALAAETSSALINNLEKLSK